MKLIANVISLNSAPELPAMLESLKGRVDALVAVDGGSKDATVSIFEKWGEDTGTPVTVLRRPWPDDFALQRNNALWWTRAAMCGGEEDVWILMIDTDDVLAQFDRQIIEKAAAEVDAEGRPVHGILCHMDNGNGYFHFCQLFRLTPDAVWTGSIHEFICVPGLKGMPPKGTVTIKRGHSAQHGADPERNVRIGRRLVEAEAGNSRARFYLARDLIECAAIPITQRYAEAEGHLRAYMQMKTNFITQDRYALLLLVNIVSAAGRLGEARDLLIESLKNDPDNRSAYESLARLSPDPAESKVWSRLSDAAVGKCVLPHGNKLPKKVVAKG